MSVGKPVGNVYLGRRFIKGEDVAILEVLIEDARLRAEASKGKRQSAFGEVEE